MPDASEHPQPQHDGEEGPRKRLHHNHMSRARRVGQAARPNGVFRRFAQAASSAMGRPWAFTGAAGIVILWAATGPLFQFSDTWQLVINTGTTIITFLMVFLIQNTQNRDTEALRLKLDELILATREARNEFVDIEDLDDKVLESIEKEMRKRAGSRQ